MRCLTTEPALIINPNGPWETTMRDTIKVRSWPAIGFGAFFAAVTTYVLFDDVLHGAPITTAHVLTAAALVGAIASGAFAWPALKSMATFMPGVLLSVLFVATTGYIVISSGARNAETAANKSAAILSANAAREHEMKLRGQAEAMKAEAERNLAAECKSGDGKRCRGIQATINVYVAAIAGHDAKLAKLPEPKVANGYAHAAKVFRSWGIPATAEWLELNVPFLVVLITELGTVAFMHLGIGHARRPKPRVIDIPSVDVEPDPPGTREQAISWIKAYEAKHGHKPKLKEIQQKFPVGGRELPKTTAHRYRAAC